MLPIVLKRHPFKFYFSIILGTLFFVGVATGLLLNYTSLAGRREPKAKEQLMVVFSIGCYCFAGYTIYRYVKNAPIITLDKDFISFNNATYSIKDIKKVNLTGKRPFKYAIDFPMEAATITFSDNDVRYIFDDMYSNTWEIKSFLKQVVVEKKSYDEYRCLAIDKEAVASDLYQTFKGNQLTSMRGLTLWCLPTFFVYMIVNNSRPNTVGLMIFACSFSTFWFIAHSYMMHYFQVSDHYFVVRNHNFFWKRKAYNLSDIKEIVFETQGKMPNCLRVITKDFKTKLYLAGTLRDKTWLELKAQLRSHKIRVRNECI